MNKSKFLKKSLAMLLAIMMVVAMIPLSAAAEDAPTDPGDPEIWVNSQLAKLGEGADGYDGEYTVKVEDTASMSIRDNTPAGYTAYAILKRTVSPTDDTRIEEKLPYSRLDLRSEAFEIEENVSYYVDLEMRKNDDATQKKSYKLTINLEDTTAFDTTDLRAVRVNQMWREGVTDYKFNAVEGKFDNVNHTITITLPVGFKPADAGLGTQFGDIVGDAGPATGSATASNTQWRQVFVPQSPDAAVQYIAPSTDQTKAQVVVTARDGRTATYDVTFKYEQALTDISVVDRNVGVKDTADEKMSGAVGQASGITMTAAGEAVIYIPVENYIDQWYSTIQTNDDGHSDHWSLHYTKGEGLVRVEDPADTDLGTWAPTAAPAATDAHDYPLISEFNTIKFLKPDATSDPTAYLTVITQANWYEDDSNYGESTGTEDNRADDKATTYNRVYANVKVVLTKGVQGGTSTGGTAVKVTEIQLDGYEAVVNKAGFTPGEEIEIYVDNDAYQAPGWDTSVQHRLTVTSNGTKLTIPEQNSSSTDPYWQVPVISLASGRLNKAVLNNVNVAGHRFNLQVATNGQVANFPIVLKKAGSYGTEMTHFRLYDAKNNKWYDGVKDSANGKQFNVTIPEDLLKNEVTWSSVSLAGDGDNLHLEPLYADKFWYRSTFTGTNDDWALDFSQLKSNTAFVEALAALKVTGTNTQLTATYNATGNASNGPSVDIKLGTKRVAYVDLDGVSDIATVETLPLKLDDNTALTSVVTIKRWNSTEKYGPFAYRAHMTKPGHKEGADGTGGTWQFAAKAASVTADVSTAKPAASLSSTPATAAGLDEVTAATNIGITYTRTSDPQSISTWLKGLEVYAHVSKGAVTLPGADNGTTAWAGLNGDPTNQFTTGASTNYVPTTPSVQYSEIENSVTKLGDIWTTSYTKGGDDTITEVLYLRVVNGNNERFKDTYTVKLVKEGKPGGITDDDVGTDASLTVDTAMTGIDEDLIHGGNTITDIASGAKDTDLLTKTAQGTTPETYAGGRVTREIDTDNNAYIGTKDDTSFPVEIKSLGDGASAIVVKVPYDFDEDSKVYFWNALLNGKTDNAKGTLIRWDPAGTPDGGAANDGVYAPVTGNYSLDKYDQAQQGAPVMSFEFTTDEIANAWNGTKVNASAVSKENILYVYSEKEKNKWSNHVTATPGDDDADITTTKDGATTPNHIYYVVLEKGKASADTSLKKFVPDTSSQATAQVNQTSKIITLTVPFSWNWVSYRDDDTRDFTIDFGVGQNATLLDVYHDTARLTDVPMVAVHSNSTQVDVKSQYINQLQDFNAWKANETKFFVKDGELYIFNKASGEEIQVTGLANNTNDQYRNAAHNNITAGNTELRIYDEAKKNINTYKLVVNVGSANKIADIGTIKVGEDFAKVDENDELSYKAEVPDDSDLTSLALEITTASPLASSVQVTTVDGTETYDANNYLTKRWNLSEGATIVITAEDGVTKKTYKLSVNNAATIDPTPTPPVTDDPTPTSTPDFDASKYADLEKLSEGVRAEVIAAMKAGLVQGIKTDEEPYQFGVGLNMRRYELALLIARAKLREAGETGSAKELDEILVNKYGTETPFTDLGNRSDAAKAAIAYCLEKGYMNGRPGNVFDPNGYISRQEATTAIARVAGLSNENTDVSMFKDGDKIANYAKGYVKAAYDAGLVNGVGDGSSFAPTDNILRQHAVCLLARYFLDEDGNIKNPDEGDEPENPDEGDEPSNPDEGDEPSTPDEGDEPSTPDEGDEPSTPDEGGDTSEPSTPDEGGDTSEPTE